MTNPLPKADVVVIGTGAGGGISSYVLTKAGVNVVAIEAGPWLDEGDFTSNLDELGGFDMRNELGKWKVNHEVPTWRPNAQTPVGPTPVPPFLMNNGVGGSTIHWTGQAWRFTNKDFRIRSTTIDAYGEDALPTGSTIADWPLDYAELEPYYDNAEYLTGVSGAGGSNPFEEQRKRDYPMPPLQPRGFAEMVGASMTKQGYHPFPGPAGITSQPYNGRPACTYCGFCTGYGCWTNAKASMHVTAIPEAQKTGKLEIRTNSRVTELLSNDKGEVTGVKYVDDQGQEQEQPAGAVVLSAYTYENVRLLLLSRSGAYPDGLANNHGQVGRNYMAHTYLGANGLFPGHRLNWDSGTAAQGICIDDLNSDNFDHAGLGFIRGGITTVGAEQRPIGMSRIVPPDVPQWGLEYRTFLEENAQAIGTVGTQLETLPYEANFIDLDPNKTDPYGIPVVRLTFDIYDNEHTAGKYIGGKLEEILKAAGATKAWGGGDPVPFAINSHAYGGARMGDDPATSVVNKYSQAHEAPNLLVLGGATFPSTTGYNPTLTIEALAWMAAEHLAENLDSIAI